MRRVFMAISILLLLVVIYISLINFQNYAAVNFSTLSGQIFSRAIRVSTYTVLVLLSGIFVGAGTVYMFLSAQKDKVKAYKRELEKTSVAGADNASRVEVLEAKIKTLEKAFNTVIDERTQLEIQIKSLNSEIDNMRKKGN
jgi:septal ring factor EnvC (AmiA/AmiB activator)